MFCKHPPQGLPRFATVRRLNDLIKRARLAKVHALILSHLKSKMPMVGKDAKKKELLKKLQNTYDTLQSQHSIPACDFPNIDDMKEKLEKYDFSKFNSEVKRYQNKSSSTIKKVLQDRKMMERLDKMMANDIPRLMNLIPHEDRELKEDGRTHVATLFIKNFLSFIVSGYWRGLQTGEHARGCGHPGGARGDRVDRGQGHGRVHGDIQQARDIRGESYRYYT